MDLTRAISFIPVLRGVSSQAVAVVHRHGRVSAVGKGDSLWLMGDRPRGLFFLLAGTVRVVREEGGRQVVVHDVRTPGECFGEVPLFTDTGYPAHAIAADDVSLLQLPADAVAALLAADVRVAERLLSGLAARVDGLVKRLGSLSTASVQERLVARLVAAVELDDERLVVRYGSHALLAAQLGTAREVVSRGIARLRDAGLVTSGERGTLCVLDLEGLRVGLSDR